MTHPLVAIIDLEKYSQLERKNYDELLQEIKEIRFKPKDTKSENIDQAIAEAVLAAKKSRVEVIDKFSRRQNCKLVQKSLA